MITRKWCEVLMVKRTGPGHPALRGFHSVVESYTPRPTEQARSNSEVRYDANLHLPLEPRRRAGRAEEGLLESQASDNAFLDKDRTTCIPPETDLEKTLYR
jgi:hypothetical protein